MKRTDIKPKPTAFCKYSQCGIEFNRQNTFQTCCNYEHTRLYDLEQGKPKKSIFTSPIMRSNKPIPKQSEKRKKDTAIYLKKRIEFLNENPICQVCNTRSATECHHTFSAKDRGKYYLDQTTWMAVCRTCHNWIHDKSKEARELGFLR